jgi:hypothetical protein
VGGEEESKLAVLRFYGLSAEVGPCSATPTSKRLLTDKAPVMASRLYFCGSSAGVRGPMFVQLAHLSRVLTYEILEGLRLVLVESCPIMRRERVWRALLLTLCALVFMFALRAKLSVYNGGGPPKVTPATASKLWLSGQKLEVAPVDSANNVLFWVGVLCLFGLCLHRELRVQSILITPPPRTFSLRYIHRFLRPPPIQS